MNPLDWQSLLFVPAHQEKLVLSAIRHRPDAVILDLEDGVAADRKDEARNLLTRHQALLAEAGLDCIIRINGELDDARLDIAATDLGKLRGIMVPKCAGLQSIDRPASLLAGNAVPLIALIESPGALPHLTQIATAAAVCALMFGSEDYAAELGLFAYAADLTVPAALVAAAAVAAKKGAIGIPGSVADFTDIAGFTESVRKARRLGFRAAAAIHPAQLPAIREGFKPAESEIKRARDIVNASDGAQGAVNKGGAMVDAPIVAQARRTLKQAGAD